MLHLAPIVLFVHNRPDHTRQVIESLLANPLAKESNLFIYSDAAKNHETQEKVLEVRKYIHTIAGFKNVKIIERKRNFGLAENIIDGVTSIVNQYGKIIILEDDIVVSPAFLSYMNNALTCFEKEKKVWCISAWNYPLDPNPIQEDTFFWRIPHCWGWGTWDDRWQHYKRDIQWVENNFTKQDIYEISLHGVSDYWQHYVLNRRGKIKTWAIFWYLSAYKNQALTLMPKTSLIKQIGLDNSGTHCSSRDPLASDHISTEGPKHYPTEVQESQIALDAIKDFHIQHQRNVFFRLASKIKGMFF